ncbi:MAG: superfamily II DNA/RNA helicase [Paracoccaceae bacterium]|jgi:superfamily II DNA/RNA helicase
MQAGMSFSDLGLSPELLKAIADAGYVDPTPIQKEAIPYVLMTRDVLGCAQTGTGKTASFTLPMIEILSSGRAKARMPRSLILTPTRELATQIAENFEIYGKYHKLTMALLIGGVSMVEQTKKLDRGVDVLIATPGRLLDHFERGRILLNDIKVLVIDEADRMLDMGFIPDVEKIVSLLPKMRQTLFFSATMAPEIRRLSDAFLQNPKEITVAPKSRPVTETVTQGIAVVSQRAKGEALRKIIAKEDIKTAIIFCNRKRDVDTLGKSLKSHGMNAAALHGDMDQSSRNDTLERFKNGEINFLVASDVAARGLDIDDLPAVFNYDVPMQAEDYIHRIGRTGRAGKSGQAFTLATPSDGMYVDSIEKLIGNTIPRIEVDGHAAEALEEGDGRKRGRSRRGTSSSSDSSASKDKSSGRSPRKPREDREPRKTEASSGTEEKPREEKPRTEASTTEKPPEEKSREAKPRNRGGRNASADKPSRRRDKPDGENHSREKSDNKGDRKGDRGGNGGKEKKVIGLGDHVPAFLQKPARPS